MKNNKKGFTLVELLAVIVILGVLLLIAVPSVNNIINSSRKNSFVSVAKLAVENVETLKSVSNYDGTCYLDLNETDIPLERGTYGEAVGFVLIQSGTVSIYAYDGKTKTLINGETLSSMSASTFGPSNQATVLDAAKVRALNTTHFDGAGTPTGTPPIGKCNF